MFSDFLVFFFLRCSLVHRAVRQLRLRPDHARSGPGPSPLVRPGLQYSHGPGRETDSGRASPWDAEPLI